MGYAPSAPVKLCTQLKVPEGVMLNAVPRLELPPALVVLRNQMDWLFHPTGNTCTSTIARDAISVCTMSAPTAT